MTTNKRYVEMIWPEIQDYFNHENFSEEVYYDPKKNIWLMPEEWLQD